MVFVVAVLGYFIKTYTHKKEEESKHVDGIKREQELIHNFFLAIFRQL